MGVDEGEGAGCGGEVVEGLFAATLGSVRRVGGAGHSIRASLALLEG